MDGKPLMLEDSFMPVKLFRNLSAHLEGSKFDYIEKVWDHHQRQLREPDAGAG